MNNIGSTQINGFTKDVLIKYKRNEGDVWDLMKMSNNLHKEFLT